VAEAALRLLAQSCGHSRRGFAATTARYTPALVVRTFATKGVAAPPISRVAYDARLRGGALATLGQQVLKQVVDKFGGSYPVAERLGVTDTLVQHFVSGALPVPESILLKAVDLLDTPPSKPQEPTGNKPNAT